MIQIKLFTIPIYDYDEDQKELNKFLKSNKILDIESKLISNDNNTVWCFCIKYMENVQVDTNIHPKKAKVDYKEVLDKNTFVPQLMGKLDDYY